MFVTAARFAAARRPLRTGRLREARWTNQPARLVSQPPWPPKPPFSGASSKPAEDTKTTSLRDLNRALGEWAWKFFLVFFGSALLYKTYVQRARPKREDDSAGEPDDNA
ncbi:hypothetical protein ABW21_db0201472 [Orbilia brochopaga]|nr:hypothetical protein ABW21_db0201472 [Drechslerella brochopaga]